MPAPTDRTSGEFHGPIAAFLAGGPIGDPLGELADLSDAELAEQHIDACNEISRRHDQRLPTNKLQAHAEALEDEIARRKLVDLGGPDGGRYWRVTSNHMASHPDARNAAVHARATGSVGATYNAVAVTRAAPPPE